jgi:hypothetical protein
MNSNFNSVTCDILSRKSQVASRKSQVAFYFLTAFLLLGSYVSQAFNYCKEVANFDNVSNGFTFSVANFYTDTYTVRYITQDTVKIFQLVVHHN